MLIATEATIKAIVLVLQTVPIGTNLGLAHLMWAMANGSFLSSRGSIFPALQLCGLGIQEMRRSWSAMRSGSWGRRISIFIGGLCHNRNRVGRESVGRETCSEHRYDRILATSAKGMAR